MTACSHYWLISPPSGPTSKGRCKICGAEREFKNSPIFEAGDYGKTARVLTQRLAVRKQPTDHNAISEMAYRE